MFINGPFNKSTGSAIVAEANLRWGDFLFQKIVVTVLAVFLSFWSWLPDIIWVFTNLKDSTAPWVFLMPFLLVNSTWECLIIDLTFFFWNHLFLCVYQWCGFSRYKFFHFWSQCLADIVVLMCSISIIYSILLV